MKKQTYQKMIEAINSSPAVTGFIIRTDSILTKISYIVYPLFMIFLLIKKEPGILQAFLVPGISFILISLFRNIYCAPRPYEVFDLKPVIEKNTCGKSFPSRHVFSIFIIAVTAFYFYPILGIILGIVGILMSALRVMGGVHFIKDVVAGAVIGIGCGIIGFYIIPLSFI